MTFLDRRIPPLALFVVVAVLMKVAAVVWPGPSLPIPGRRAIAILLAAIGVAVCGAGVTAFRRRRTTMNPLRPQDATTIVRTGIYRWTRNPMYLGLALILAGWAVDLARATAWVPLAGFVVYLDRFQIRPEERALRERFGEAFDAYARTVRRWL